MKERITYDGDFEKQLKEKADQFKMYPSDKVWNNLNSSLHTGRRNFVAGMSVLIGGILFLAATQLIMPSKNILTKNVSAKANTSVKPPPAATLRGFSVNDYTTAANGGNDQGPGAGGQQASVPYLISAAGLADYQSSIDQISKSSPEKFQNDARLKSISPAELKNSDGPLAALTLQSDEKSAANELVLSSVPAEVIPEKSVAMVTRTHNERFSWEIFVAPTLNTHYLNGTGTTSMNQRIQSAPVMVVHIANVNGFVDNTPAMGYEVGGNILYRVSKIMSLKAGVDFSFSRYNIKAYNSNQSQAATTLSPYLGYIADSLVVGTNTGLGGDKNPQQYQNKYYQLSFPVGVEMKVAGNGKLQLHIGATVEPSYLLNTDSYVLSGDFTSYSKQPQVFRRWNLNAGAEAYISYAIGKIRWEIGPQVRYQIFSTYKNDYPFQENMLNYGIRIGISKSIR
jgi:hypothetical protein